MHFRFPLRVVAHDNDGNQYHMDVDRIEFQLMMASLKCTLEDIHVSDPKTFEPVLVAAKQYVRDLQGEMASVRVDIHNPLLFNLWRHHIAAPLTRLVLSVNDSERGVKAQLCQLMRLSDQPNMSITDLYTLITGYIYSARCYDVLLCGDNGRLMVLARYDTVAGLGVPYGPQLRLPHPTLGFDLVAILTEYHIGTLLQGAPYYIDHI